MEFRYGKVARSHIARKEEPCWAGKHSCNCLPHDGMTSEKFCIAPARFARGSGFPRRSSCYSRKAAVHGQTRAVSRWYRVFCVLQVLSQLDRHPVVVGSGRSEPLGKLTRLAESLYRILGRECHGRSYV